MFKKLFFLSNCLLFIFAFFKIAYADTYSLAPNSVFSPSGESSNANYSVKHTLGQPLIGESASIDHRLQAGFSYIVDEFAYEDIDGDGLPDDWEMSHFGNLNQGAGDDPDGDQLTNIEEFQLGTDPNDGISDTDGDKLLDRWELDYFGNLSQSKDDDPDIDGISNYLEYKLGTNPSDLNDRPNPGLFYEYDALGRIKQIIRIPSN